MAGMGFHKDLIKWVQVLYADPLARVRTGREFSDTWSIHRGTRQGCSLSPLLFALAIEPLACRIRELGTSHGILISGYTHSVSLYADDLLVYLRDVTTGLAPLLEILHEFGRLSGLKLNSAKSCIFPLTDAGARWLESQPADTIPVALHTFKYLGIHVHRTAVSLREDNLGRAMVG